MASNTLLKLPARPRPYRTFVVPPLLPPRTGHLCIAGGIREGLPGQCQACQTARALRALADLEAALRHCSPAAGSPLCLRVRRLIPTLTEFSRKTPKPRKR